MHFVVTKTPRDKVDTMNFLKALRCAIPLAALTGLLPSTASAGPTLPTLLPSMPCSVDSFSIKTVEVSPLNGAGTIFSGTQNATSCKGLYTGNDSGNPFNNPNPNIGQLGDGLLNGQAGVLSPTWFNNPSAPSPMLDLDNNGSYTDPGWIYLGKTENGTGSSFVMDAYDKPLDLASILNVKMNCVGDCTQGTWSLETSLDIIEQVQNVLGRNSFDHLAFVIKASDRFAVYDFDFNMLSSGIPGFNYTTPYSFTGEWNTDDFLNPKNSNAQDFSHISVWARDPVGTPPTLLPEPGSLLLTGLGLIAMVMAMVQKRRVKI